MLIFHLLSVPQEITGVKACNSLLCFLMYNNFGMERNLEYFLRENVLRVGLIVKEYGVHIIRGTSRTRRNRLQIQIMFQQRYENITTVHPLAALY